MFIVRKDQLKLVEPDSEILKKRPSDFSFNQYKDDAKSLCNVMLVRMKELGGIGLSANQVGLDIRMFVMGDEDNHLFVFNPEILEFYGEPDTFREGCLTYPGLFLNIKRPPSIKVRYQNEKGEMIETIFSGITSRIFQHEYEHMEGKTFLNNASKFKLNLAKKKYNNLRKKIIRKHAVKTMVEALNESTKSE